VADIIGLTSRIKIGAGGNVRAISVQLTPGHGVSLRSLTAS